MQDETLKCYECTHFRFYLDHPRYGKIEFIPEKNVELYFELARESEHLEYAECEKGVLEHYRRVRRCDMYYPKSLCCSCCGKPLPKH